MAKLLTLYKFSLRLAIWIVILMLGCILYHQINTNYVLVQIAQQSCITLDWVEKLKGCE
jgi:hypothetical protein